jgi:hypothetical protein
LRGRKAARTFFFAAVTVLATFDAGAWTAVTFVAFFDNFRVGTALTFDSVFFLADLVLVALILAALARRLVVGAPASLRADALTGRLVVGAPATLPAGALASGLGEVALGSALRVGLLALRAGLAGARCGIFGFPVSAGEGADERLVSAFLERGFLGFISTTPR